MGKYIERNGIGYELITRDVVEVTDSNGEKLGDIFINEGDWELILDGADPIAEGWEDGRMGMGIFLARMDGVKTFDSACFINSLNGKSKIKVAVTNTITTSSNTVESSIGIDLDPIIPSYIDRSKIILIAPKDLNTNSHNNSCMALRRMNISELNAVFSVIGNGATQTFNVSFYILYYE